MLSQCYKADGGNLKFVGMDSDGIVYILLQGACVSCPSSSITLKNGIERMLMHWVPEVLEVQEVDENYAREWNQQEQKGAGSKSSESPK